MPRQHRQQQQCHDVGDFDHGVYGGAGGVFVGVADGVAGDGCLVGIAAFQVLDAFRVNEAIFKRLLRVVPGAAACCHGNGHKQSSYDDAHQHGTDGGEGLRLACDGVDDEVDDDGRQHGQHRRQDHFLDGGLGQQVYGPCIIRL